ncbi:MAG: glycosyl hydrolase, partial [Ilumatobacteraceae bacterium]
ETISPDLTYADPDTMGVSGPLTMDTAGAEMYATIFSLMVSAHERGVLMAGSDDGKVHLTTDDGGSWTDVTPSDLPKFSQVTMIAESPHTPGTLYLTAARHKTGDDEPYVLRTDDLGTTWTRIDADLPRHEFCRVVREDPKRQGLLYVGTEFGIHVSFDDGAHWQSLQANLPTTPVYDMVVKDDDLVVATHGRSFWILDDLTPLHQMHDDLLTADHHLLRPRDVVRMLPHITASWGGTPGGKNYHVTSGQNATFYVTEHDTGHTTKRCIDAGDDLEPGATITYFLREDAVGEASLIVTDADGTLIDTFPSVIPAEKKDRTGLYITAHAGMNRFQWPLTLPAGTKMTGTEYHTAAVGPMVVPGRYLVTLRVGDWSMTQPFDVVPDPRVDTQREHLVEQFELLVRLRDRLSEIADGVNDIRTITGQLNDWIGRLEHDTSAADTVQAARDLIGRLGTIELELVQPELTAPGDSLNYREMLFEKLGHLPPVVASADARPTTQSYEVFDKLSAQAGTQLDALARLVDGDVAEFNSRLADLGVAVVGVPARAGAPAP